MPLESIRYVCCLILEIIKMVENVVGSNGILEFPVRKYGCSVGTERVSAISTIDIIANDRELRNIPIQISHVDKGLRLELIESHPN